MPRARRSNPPLNLLQLHSFEEFTNFGAPVTLVECIGELTGNSPNRLFDHLLLQLDYGPRHILLDLGKITAADHVVAGLLASVSRRARSSECSFCLISPSPAAVAGLELLGINRPLVVHEDLSAALLQLEGGPS